MKVYLFTIPKAGTYFISAFLENMGLKDTGFHVGQGSFLNTKKLGIKENAEFPGRAKEDKLFVHTLRSMQDNELAFGHFAVPLMPNIFPQFSFICSYRHPRRTLTSEFIDFRFRRKDIPWIMTDRIPNDRDAFCEYLRRHGKNHLAIFSQMIAVSALVAEPLCPAYAFPRYVMLNFDDLLRNETTAREVALALGLDENQAPQALERTKNSETKTKATDLRIDRDGLWTDQAEEEYKKLNAEAYVARGRELGWRI